MTNPFIKKRENLLDLQSHVQQELDELAEDDIGAGFQAAAYWHGELVLNAFSGSADSVGRRSVTSDTILVVQSCSKGLTIGWILGETAFRADGRSFAQIVHDEICKPLDIEKDLYLGATAEAESRIAEISGEALITNFCLPFLTR